MISIKCDRCEKVDILGGYDPDESSGTEWEVRRRRIVRQGNPELLCLACLKRYKQLGEQANTVAMEASNKARNKARNEFWEQSGFWKEEEQIAEGEAES